MRTDRRKTYPLFDPADSSITGITTDAITAQALTTVRKGGVIKPTGTIPLNLLAVSLKNPYLYKVMAEKLNKGGVSSFAGSRR